MTRALTRFGFGGLGLLACLALAGCSRPVELTAKPPESPDLQAIESGPAAVFVAEAVDLSRVEDQLGRVLTVDIANIARRLRGAACTTTGSKQVCLDARLAGRVVRDGKPQLGGTAHGLELRIPIRYELAAQPIGPGSATPITGKLVVVASFAVTMDERWQPTLKLDPVLKWPDGNKVKVLAGETSLQADVEPVLNAQLQRLQPSALAGLVPADLRQQVELAWRYLHYPLPLSHDQQIWMRGTPLGLHFAGLKAAGTEQELRIVITARLQTFVGDRPAPLPPSPLPALGSGPEPAGGGIVLVSEVPFDALNADAARHLPAIPSRTETASASSAKIQVSALAFFPAGKRLGLGVHLSLPATNGGWFNGHGIAYYMATPDMRPGSSQIVLNQCELFASTAKAPARQKDYSFLTDPRFADAIGQSVTIDVADKLIAAVDVIKRQPNLPLAKGLKLWLQPGDPKVVKITTGLDALRLQIETGGEFVIRKDGPDIASGGDSPKATP